MVTIGVRIVKYREARAESGRATDSSRFGCSMPAIERRNVSAPPSLPAGVEQP
jgi:hypothetical protein